MEEETVVVGDCCEDEEQHPGPGPSVPTLVPFSQRVISASVGSLLTSLVTNPLDVVKTRVQTSYIPPPSATTTAAAAATAMDGACQDMYAIETVHGAKVSYTKSTSEVVYRGTADGLIKIFRQEGLAGWYRGLSPSLAMAVPSTVLYYSLYDSLRAALGREEALLAPLLAGSTARICAATATAPLELLRTRAQVGREGGREGGREEGRRDFWTACRVSGWPRSP
ncbi:hypothetical protein VYU27_009751 [Nannochloropsis oceanica]